MILSIVLPVYNVAQYLGKCIDSCLNQNIPSNDYEILIINDGSVDSSGEIGETFASSYDNIHIIHQENKGLSGARNTGLNLAKGKYIWFIDSDDWIEPNVLRDIINKMEESNPDTMVVNFYKIDQNDTISPSSIKNSAYNEKSIYTGTEYFKKRAGDFLNSWRYVSNIEFLRRNNLYFYEGIVHEDNEHTPKLLFFAHKVITYNLPIYAHLIRSGSIMTTFNPKKIDSWFKIFNSLKNFRSQLSEDSEFRIYLNQYLLQQYSNYLTNRNQYDLDNEDILKLKKLKPIEKWSGMEFQFMLKYQLIDRFPVQYSQLIRTYNKYSKP